MSGSPAPLRRGESIQAPLRLSPLRSTAVFWDSVIVLALLAAA